MTAGARAGSNGVSPTVLAACAPGADGPPHERPAEAPAREALPVGRTILHRPARMAPPAVPTGELVVQAPPQEQRDPGFSWWPQLLFPLVTSMGAVYFIVYSPTPIFVAISITVAAASISLSVAMVLQQIANSRRRAGLDRERYLDYLRRLARQARQTARQQDEALRFLHPGRMELWAIACGRVRVWERRLAHPDFATARVGLGKVSLATPLRLEGGADPLSQRDSGLLAAAQRVVDEYGQVAGQPVVLDLASLPAVSLVGPPAATRPIARAVVTELATLCSPDDLQVAVCVGSEAEGAWEFTRWLPHLASEDGPDLLCGDGQHVLAQLADEILRRRERARRRTGSAYLERSAADEAPQRRLLLVVDGYSASSPLARLDALAELAARAADLDVSLLFLVEAQRDEPPTVSVRLRVQTDGSFSMEDMGGRSVPGRAEADRAAIHEAIARRLAPLQLGERDGGAVLGETCELVDLLGVRSARQLDPASLWSSRAPRDVLRVPIGVGSDGAPTVLDLKEAALGGMGPHGLVVGATGSGKSELLRTVVTALAVTHSPEVLSLVLVDFKGGAAFAGLAGLPHVAGMITNLADDLTMVDRMHAALFGEIQRRQGLLRRAGNLDSVGSYQQRRAAGRLPGAEPLPYLLLIVDEFSELLASRPDFIDLFVAIGRVGRSLGMHLLLASQRLEEGRLRGLDSHLSYRICLRTFSAGESHAVVGTPDAYHLPSIPGSAYLKVHTDIFERFKAALVTAPDRAEVAIERPPSGLPARGLAAIRPLEERVAEPAPAEDADEQTVMTLAVERVRATGAAHVHQVWLPPLQPRVPLGQLLPLLAAHRGRGLQALGGPPLGSMRAPLGVLDLPMEQAQRPFLLDLAGWAGHLAVVGAPQSGKSTLLRTLLLSLVAMHTPDEVRAYIIDYGGGSLFSLARAPHVGDVAGRVDPEKVRRTVAQVWSLVDERDVRLRELGVDSVETMRRRRAAGTLPLDLGADVLLVIDGWGAVREEMEELEAEVRDIAARGLRVGCHLVLASNRWADIRANLRDSIGGRLELRLNDPSESEIDRRAAAGIPSGIAGRALAPDRNQVQVALPDLGPGVEEVMDAAAAAWSGSAAPAVRMLPARVTTAELPMEGREPEPGVPIGVDEFELGPVYLDLEGADTHFLVLGDSEAGKTTFLRSWLAGLQARTGPAEAMFLVVDYRRTLLGAVRPEQLWAYSGAAPQAVAAVQELAQGIIERLPPANLSPEAIRARSWWHGPDFYVVVDDYDLVASSTASPLAPLVDLLAQGRDLGMHVVLARRVGGMTRAGYEPLLNRIRELNAPGLILSGDRAEGPLLGPHRAANQPPGRGLLVRRKQRAMLIQVLETS